ncbi:MAG: SDR family oxidoreductase [Patescibacteria group bacterium]
MKDKVIVITGGSKGLGKGLANILANNSNRVVICARHEVELDKTAKEIGAIPFLADVAKEEDVELLAAYAVKEFGCIDLWINNAGIWLPHASIEDTDLKKVQEMFLVNVFGTMNGSKIALTQMRKQGHGTVVNIISTSGLIARPQSSGYAASKWAVRGFTDSIREEVKGTDIHVLSVYPGGMQTDLFGEQKPEEMNKYMTFESVAEKIIENLDALEPLTELIIKRT